jgi:HEAT repeat protein
MAVNVFISSTYKDLKDFRSAVQLDIKKLGLNDLAMEYFVAEDCRPLERCLIDVRQCDLYIGIFAWRYGFIPPHQSYSITELEYREAGRLGIERIIFMLDNAASWPPAFMDVHTGDGEQGRRILEFRMQLCLNHQVSFFFSQSDLSNNVTHALHRWLNQHSLKSNIFTHGSQYSASIRSYLEALLVNRSEIEHRYVPLSGISEAEAMPVPPTEWPIDLLPSSFRLLKGLLSTYKTETSETRTFDSIDDCLAIYPRFILAGEPGSGKTTSLKHLRTLTAQSALDNHTVLIPIIINLAEWPDNVLTLKELILNELHAQALPPLSTTRMLLLFDGLNEISETVYDATIDAIMDWLNINPYTNVIFASRVDHLQSNRYPSLPIITICPLNDDKIVDFIYKYLGLADGDRLLYELDWDSRLIDGSRHLASLTRNPFLLALICFIFFNNKHLPQTRGQLFRLFIKILYQREADRKFDYGLCYNDLVYGLSSIAIAMLKGRSSTAVSREWASKHIPNNISHESLINLGIHCSILTRSKGDRFIQFSHQLLMEYCAAEYLLTYPVSPSYLPSLQIANGRRIPTVLDNVLRVMIGLSNADEILLSIAVLDPFLAQDLMQEIAGELSDPASIGTEIATRLAANLGGKYSETAADALSRMGQYAITPLINTFHTDISPSIKRQIIVLLSTIGTIEALTIIVEALHDSNRWVRRDARDCLLEVDDMMRRSLLMHYESHNDVTHSLPLLRQLYAIQSQVSASQSPANVATTALSHSIDEATHVSPVVQMQAADTIDGIGDTKHISSLELLVNDSNIGVRANAIYAIISLGGRETLKRYIGILSNRNPHIKQMVDKALGKIGLKYIRHDLEVCISACNMINTPDYLLSAIEATKHLSSDVRKHAARALGVLGDKTNIPHLEPLVYDDDIEVRAQALHSIISLGSYETYDSFINYFRDIDPNTRKITCKVFGELQIKSVAPEVERCIHDSDDNVRYEALLALSRIAPWNTPDMIHAMLRPSGDVKHQRLAFYALRNVVLYLHNSQRSSDDEHCLYNNTLKIIVNIRNELIESLELSDLWFMRKPIDKTIAMLQAL